MRECVIAGALQCSLSGPSQSVGSDPSHPCGLTTWEGHVPRRIGCDRRPLGSSRQVRPRAPLQGSVKVAAARPWTGEQHERSTTMVCRHRLGQPKPHRVPDRFRWPQDRREDLSAQRRGARPDGYLAADREWRIASRSDPAGYRGPARSSKQCSNAASLCTPSIPGAPAKAISSSVDWPVTTGLPTSPAQCSSTDEHFDPERGNNT